MNRFLTARDRYPVTLVVLLALLASFAFAPAMAQEERPQDPPDRPNVETPEVQTPDVEMPSLEIEVQREDRVWFADPVWIIVGIVVLALILLLVVLASRGGGGGTTVIRD